MSNFIQTIMGIIKLHPVLSILFLVLLVCHLIIAFTTLNTKGMTDSKWMDSFIQALFAISGILSSFLCVWLISLIHVPVLNVVVALLAALVFDVLAIQLISILIG